MRFAPRLLRKRTEALSSHVPGSHLHLYLEHVQARVLVLSDRNVHVVVLHLHVSLLAKAGARRGTRVTFGISESASVRAPKARCGGEAAVQALAKKEQEFGTKMRSKAGARHVTESAAELFGARRASGRGAAAHAP